MSSAPQKVSFTVRRPSPPSRTESSGGDSDNAGFRLPALPRRLVGAHDSKPGSPLAASSPDRTPISYYSPDPDSSDEEDGPANDELLTSFDQISVQRSSKKRKSDNGPLVIPVLKNKDWREMARKRRGTAQYVPASAQAQATKNGSATRDSVNTGPVLAGLQIKKKETIVKFDAGEEVGIEEQGIKMEVEETEDERALRAVLASAEGTETESSAIRIIPTPITESDALKQDVAELPDVATLDDYERVPVSQFGAALLRGMGWKEGTAASRNGKGLVQPYLPQARPAMLGIGAKEKEVLDDGSGKKRPGRPERRYVPVVRKERDDEPASDTPRSSNRSSRRSSRSPDRRKERGYEDSRDTPRDRRYNGDLERDRDRYRAREKDRGRDRDGRDSGRDSDRRRNGDQSEKDRQRNRSRESSRR
ncbi:DExH-box splicing factor binding site domain containing protein [Amanita muscaria]